MDDIQQKFNHCLKRKTEAGFHELYQASSMRLYAMAVRILKDKELANECLQEVYIKIWRKMDMFKRHKGSAVSWMTAICRNMAIDMLRKPVFPGFGDELDGVPADDEEVSETIALIEEGSALKKCLEQLKPEQERCIKMAYFKDYNYQEIADELARPLSTVKTWIRRSLPVLKKCLDKYYD